MKRKSIFTCIELLVAFVMIMLICFFVVAPAIAQQPSANSPIPSPIPNPALSGLIRVQLKETAPATSTVPKAGWVMSWLSTDPQGSPVWNFRYSTGVEKTLRALALYSNEITPAGDAQYLSAAQKVLATQTVTTARTGLLSYTDWNTFNDKVATSRTVGGNALSSNITNAQLKTSVLAATLYSNELTAAGDAQFLSATQKAVVVGNTGTIKGGNYSITAGDVSAGSKSITTGLSTIASMNIKTLRANVAQYSETITISGGSITVAGGSGYTLTENDVVYWIAVGGL